MHVASMKMRYNDIDVNGHVNSVKYIEHVLDLFSLDWYASHRLQRLEVAYVAEAHCGDTLRLYRDSSEDGLSFHVRMTKTAEGEETEVEICRSLVRFVNV